jgi:hypothetical protein
MYDFIFEYKYAYTYHSSYPLFWIDKYDIRIFNGRPSTYKKLLVLINNQIRTGRRNRILLRRFVKKSTTQEFIHVVNCMERANISYMPLSEYKYLSQEKLLYLKLQ